MADMLPIKERLKIKRHEMPALDPKERSKNFEEVPTGYSIEDAISEAQRCLQCKVPTCMDGCPAQVRIPHFIKAIVAEDFEKALEELKITNALPAVCGRVCPQETQCEGTCVLEKQKRPVAIGRLERFVADWNRKNVGYKPPFCPAESDIKGKVAIVGSGPAGIACAADLSKMFYDVTVFEALHKVGGVLRYGIPDFRLPKDILDSEIRAIKDAGVRFVTNVVVGNSITVDELAREYDAVFIGNGAGGPRMLGIPGENLNGVYSASEFLVRINLMSAKDFPDFDTPFNLGKKVVVVGAGNVAMDAARTALRLGSDTTIVYRRTRKEAPARDEEIMHAEEEGVKFHFLANPIKINGKDGKAVSIICQLMKMGEPDSSGRARPVPIKGETITLDVDTVIIAIGQQANPIVARSATGVQTNKKGYFIADPKTGQTTREGIFAGGDIVTGAATVIEAVGAGKNAANAIDKYIRSKKLSVAKKADK